MRVEGAEVEVEKKKKRKNDLMDRQVCENWKRTQVRGAVERGE